MKLKPKTTTVEAIRPHRASAVTRRGLHSLVAPLFLAALFSSFLATADVIVYSSYGNSEMVAVDEDGSGATTILEGVNLREAMDIAVSNNGEGVAYKSYVGGWSDQLWYAQSDGSWSEQVTVAPWLDCLTWLDDDSSLTYKKASLPWESIFKKDLTTGQETLWVDAQQLAPWGLNKFAVAFRWSEDTSRGTFVMGVGGGCSNTVFSADFDYDSGTLSNIVQVSPTGSGYTQTAGGCDISSDGSTVYYSWQNLGTSMYTLVEVGSDGSDPRIVYEVYDPAHTGIGNVLLSSDEGKVFFRTISTGGQAPFAVASIKPDGSSYFEIVTGEGPFFFDASATWTGEPRNEPPVADAGADRFFDANDQCAALVPLNGSASFDPDGDEISFEWTVEGGAFSSESTPSIELPLGNHEITLTVADPHDATSTDTVEITVEDHTPPTFDIAAAAPNVLWPPNHKMRSVEIQAEISDACEAVQESCFISEITSSEPVSGGRYGKTSPDWEITGPLTVDLRSERAGFGPGRTYSITVTCSDAAGNQANTQTTVVVPHDRG